MSNKNEEISSVVDNDKELDDILDKFETPEVSKASTKKKNGHIKGLVVVIAVAVALAGVGAALLFAPKEDAKTEIKGPAAVKNEVKDNVHEVEIKTDSNGKIKENGKGNLIEKVPADITKIKINNNRGDYEISSYTPKTKTNETDPTTGKVKEKTDATIYKIIGYEDFKLQDGVADEVANACSTLEFTSVSAENAADNLKDFGLDKPRATVTVTYTDKTKSVFKVGNDAAQNLGTYVMFGSGKTVFLCDKEKVSKFLLGINDYISHTINESASDASTSEFKTLTLSGSKFSRSVTLKPNPDTKHVTAANIMVFPIQTYADDSEASTVTGAVRGLMAKSVAKVNPSSSDLSNYGLANPYAKLHAEYSDITVNLLASNPNSKGDCFLMKDGGKVVYIIASASIPWVNTTEKKLISN